MEQLLPGLTSAPNLHPMVVHFPIAFWVAATGAWSWAVVRKHDDAWRFGRWLHLLGMLGAVVAVGFGFWATEKMGHDTPGHDLVHVHRDLMLVVSGIALVITALAWWRRGATRPWRVGLTLGSLVLLGLMTIGAEAPFGKMMPGHIEDAGPGRFGSRLQRFACRLSGHPVFSIPPMSRRADT